MGIEQETEVAVIGIACKFPKSSNYRSFWKNLSEGIDCIERFSPSRQSKSYSTSKYISAKPVIKDRFAFDADFFEISSMEARYTDPQHRMMLELSWQALEDSGRNPEQIREKTGVFFAANHNTYQYLNNWFSNLWNDESTLFSKRFTAYEKNTIDTLATLVSYKLNLTGPSMSIQTACSSALVCIHQACQSILLGECDLALSGGVSLDFSHEDGYFYESGMMLSKTGYCRSFDKSADGTIFGEGGGVVLLKRLDLAIEDKDQIYAVIKGSAVNNDGRRKVDFNAPSIEGQKEVLEKALQAANVSAHSIQYIEAHGSATIMGDPIEFEALKSVYKGDSNSCGIGSVKSNIGHLDAAAGVAGFIKAVLAMKFGVIPKTLYFESPNSYIDIDNTPFYFVNRNQSWKQTNYPRRCAVTSLGIGGTNGHVILEEGPQQSYNAKIESTFLPFVLSAKTEESLKQYYLEIREFVLGGFLKKGEFASFIGTLIDSRSQYSYKLLKFIKDYQDLLDYFENTLSENLTQIYSENQNEVLDPNFQALSIDRQNHLIEWIKNNSPLNSKIFFSTSLQKLSLPTYPFKKTTYLPPDTGPVASNTQKHPLIHENCSNLKTYSFKTFLKGDEYFLEDHMIEENKTFPAAAFIEMVKEAFMRLNQSYDAIEIEDVQFLHPLIVSEKPEEIWTQINSEDGSYHFSVESSEKKVYCEGKIRKCISLDSTSFSYSFSQTILPLDFYNFYKRTGIQYGKTFQVIQNLERAHYGESEIIFGKISSPITSEYHCYPNLLDGAFQCTVSWLYDDSFTEYTYIPFWIKKIQIFKPLTQVCFVKIIPENLKSYQNGIQYTLEIYNEFKVICARFTSVFEKQIQSFTPSQLISSKSINQIQTTPFSRFFEKFLKKHLEGFNRSLKMDDELSSLELDSISTVHLTNQLAELFGPLPPTLFFDVRTIEALSEFLSSEKPDKYQDVISEKKESIEQIKVYYDSSSEQPEKRNDIAIIGISGEYPQSPNLEIFWNHLKAGNNLIQEVPKSKMDIHKYFSPQKFDPGKTYSKWGGFIEGADLFDPLFFKISPKDAELMDPQEKLLMIHAWKALEDAGYSLGDFQNQTRNEVGVYAGCMYHEYQLFGAEETLKGNPIALNGVPASIANRVSYYFDFRGPSMTLDTMCSSSLTALYLACQEIKEGKIQAALVGAVNLSLHINKYLQLSQEGLLSSKGLCEAFGKGGDGYVPSEGVGCVLIKPLSNAIRDRDPVYGVIKGIEINHGGRTNSYSAPNVESQSALITKTLQRANISADDISYIEAHGTGTALGDAIEINALKRAFGSRSKKSCPIGSVKSNIGHCEATAGMAGLTKILLQIQHQYLVPTIHSEVENPNLNLEQSPFYLPKTLEKWNGNETKTCCLSSFGAGGSNAHAIIQEYL